MYKFEVKNTATVRIDSYGKLSIHADIQDINQMPNMRGVVQTYMGTTPYAFTALEYELAPNITLFANVTLGDTK